VFQSSPTAHTVIFAPGVMTTRPGRLTAVAAAVAVSGARLLAGGRERRPSSPSACRRATRT